MEMGVKRSVVSTVQGKITHVTARLDTVRWVVTADIVGTNVPKVSCQVCYPLSITVRKS